MNPELLEFVKDVLAGKIEVTGGGCNEQTGALWTGIVPLKPDVESITITARDRGLLNPDASFEEQRTIVLTAIEKVSQKPRRNR